MDSRQYRRAPSLSEARSLAAPSAHSLSLALLLLPRPLHLRDEGLHRLRALRLPHRLVHGGEVGERGDRVRVVQAVTVGQASRQFDARGLEGTVKDFGD